jgi:hypothetical protein
MNRSAIATLVLGKRYQAVFIDWFRWGWEEYCHRHSIDLVVIDEPLDTSDRAKARSPAWQKCLVHRHPQLAQRDQVAWIDADIRVNPSAPNIFDDVTEERVGIVDQYACPTREDYRRLMHMRLRGTQASADSSKSPVALTPEKYHTDFGLPHGFDHVGQTGVVVYSPSRHASIFEHAYDHYEDKGHPSWNYEMRPLSFELQKAQICQWLNPKYNLLWNVSRDLTYPFLNHHVCRRERLLRRLLRLPKDQLIRGCVKAGLESAYFLHFSGGNQDYCFLPADHLPRSTCAWSQCD